MKQHHPGKTFLRQLVVVVFVGLIAAGQVRVARALADPDICFAVADSGDRLHTIGQDGTSDTPAPNQAGVPDIEAIAFQPGTQVLFGADADELGTIDLTTGIWTTVSGNVFGTVGGALGNEAINDVDGLSFDPISGVLYGSERRGGQDLLVIIDPTTGLVDPNGFSAGVGYLVVTDGNGATTFDEDIDDIAIDPVDGTLYAVANAGGFGDQLVVIDRTTGAITSVIGGFGVNDMEGLGFFNDGTFYGTTGTASGGALVNSLWSINKATANATQVVQFSSNGDYEGIDCLVADANIKSGFVFEDAAPYDGTYDGGVLDSPLAGVTVRIYRDSGTTPGQVDASDELLATTDTDAAGAYQYTMGATGDFVLEVDISTLPAGFDFTSDNLEIVSFTNCNAPAVPFDDYGCTETDNSFAVAPSSDLSVTKAVDNQSPAVGDFVIFTITVTNAGPSDTDNVEVTDDLNGLGGLNFNSVFSISQGAYNPGTGVWTVGFMAVNDTQTLRLRFEVTAAGSQTNIAQVTAQDNFDPDSTPANSDPAEDDQASVRLNAPLPPPPAPAPSDTGVGDPGVPGVPAPAPGPALLPELGDRPVEQDRPGLLAPALVLGGLALAATGHLLTRRRRAD